jgi:hypothetical protein
MIVGKDLVAKREFENGIENAVWQIFKSQAPTRTGVLRNQIRVERTEQGFNIISDIYYMPFTNEPWISPRWRGRANPNEKWWDEAYKLALQFLSSVYGKEFKRES